MDRTVMSPMKRQNLEAAAKRLRKSMKNQIKWIKSVLRFRHTPSFCIKQDFRGFDRLELRKAFFEAKPFKHIIIDDFLPIDHAKFLAKRFPSVDHPVWLDWRARSPHQYGKQGPGDSRNFDLLDPYFRLALQEFNAAPFLTFLEEVTGIDKLLPDPYFTGGGIHQIVEGGILDIHTDFNRYDRLGMYRVLNVLIYLTDQWCKGYGGELELWDSSPKTNGKAVKVIPPIFNRAIIFKTDKTSFHGHPNEWRAPKTTTRRSIALYYYTTKPIDDGIYDQSTDFMGVVQKDLSRDY